MKARGEFGVCVNMHTRRHMERSSGPSSGVGDQGREGGALGHTVLESACSSLPSHLPGKVEDRKSVV